LRIDGIDVRDSAAAELALRLHLNGDEALAFHIGTAVDHVRPEFALGQREHACVLRALADCPDGLRDLRDALLGRGVDPDDSGVCASVGGAPDDGPVDWSTGPSQTVVQAASLN
jgi:hypothetical protein